MNSMKVVGLTLLVIVAALVLVASVSAEILTVAVSDASNTADATFKANIEIFDSNNKLVEQEIDAHKCTVSGLSAGTYLIKVSKTGYESVQWNYPLSPGHISAMNADGIYIPDVVLSLSQTSAPANNGASQTSSTNFGFETYGSTGSGTGTGTGSGTGTPATNPGITPAAGTPTQPNQSYLIYDVEYDDEAKPGEQLKFTIDVENEADMDLEDIKLTLIIAKIDNGDNLKLEADKFDLDEDDDTTITLTTKVPYDAKEKDYSVFLTWTFKGSDNKRYPTIGVFTQAFDDISIERDEHSILFTNVDMSSDTYEVGSTGTVEVDLANVGQNDENVRLKVLSRELSIDRSINFKLADGKETTQSLTYIVPTNIKDGKYTIEIIAYFDGGAKSVSDFKIVTVKTAQVIQASTQPAPVSFEVTGVDVQDSTDAVVEPTTSSNTVVAIVILVVIIAALVAVVLIDKLPKKKGEKKR